MRIVKNVLKEEYAFMEIYLTKQVRILNYLISIYKKGYWRSNRFQKVFTECMPFSDSCLEISDYVSDICEKAYLGPLCQTCNLNFAKFGGIRCLKCPDNRINSLMIIFIIIFIIVFLSFYIK